MTELMRKGHPPLPGTPRWPNLLGTYPRRDSPTCHDQSPPTVARNDRTAASAAARPAVSTRNDTAGATSPALKHAAIEPSPPIPDVDRSCTSPLSVMLSILQDWERFDTYEPVKHS